MADDRLDGTLEQLEGVVSGTPEFPSGLVTRCHALRTKPIGQFTPADLQVMIGQKIGLAHLIPLALRALGVQPLVEGDYYPGDLLESVLSLDADFWAAHRDWLARLRGVVAQLHDVPDEIRQTIDSFERRCGRTRG